MIRAEGPTLRAGEERVAFRFPREGEVVVVGADRERFLRLFLTANVAVEIGLDLGRSGQQGG